MSYDPRSPDRTTFFDEKVTTQRSSEFHLKSSWGVSRLRDITTTDGDAAVVAEDGQIKLSSGTAQSQTALLQTKERGAYEPGTQAEAGVAIRVPVAPTGNQEVQGGYFDAENGFGVKYNATDTVLFLRSATVDTDIASANWDDPLDGTGPSGITLDWSKGVIVQTEFTWYGYGNICWYMYLWNPTTELRERVLVHKVAIENDVSIIDPNQPITVQVSNGVGDTTNLEVFVGGRQFALTGGGRFTNRQRPVTHPLTDYTITAAEDGWEPILALRKKTNFVGRPNSIRVSVVGMQGQADNPAEFRITYDAVTAGGAWSAPAGWDAGETACEIKDVSAGAFTAPTVGLPIGYAFAAPAAAGGRGQSSSDRTEINERILLGSDTEVVIWARRTTANATVISALLLWEEQW
jgi:hypothetical protein